MTTSNNIIRESKKYIITYWKKIRSFPKLKKE